MHCRQCSYDLHATTTKQCPECGAPFDPDDPSSFIDSPRDLAVRRAGWSVVWLGVTWFVFGLIPAGGVKIDILALIVAWLGRNVCRGHLGAATWAMAVMIFHVTAFVLGLVAIEVMPQFAAVPWTTGVSAGVSPFKLAFLLWCCVNMWLLHACLAGSRRPAGKLPLAVAGAVLLAAGLTMAGVTRGSRAASYNQTRQVIETVIQGTTTQFADALQARRPAGAARLPVMDRRGSSSGGGRERYEWRIRLSSWPVAEDHLARSRQEHVRLVIRCRKPANPFRARCQVEIEIDPSAPDSRDVARGIMESLDEAGIDCTVRDRRL